MHPYIFNATIPFHIQDIPGFKKKIGSLRCVCVGGGGGGVHVGHI